MDRAALITRHEDLANARRREEGDWRELAQILRPDDRDFESASDVGGRNDADNFDATPLYALESFTGGMFGQLVNPANRWFELTVLEDPELARWQPVKEFFYAASNVLYGSISPGVSGFYAAAPQWIANVGAFGFGPFYQEEWVGRKAIIDLAFPIGEIYLDRDAARNVDTVHRAYPLTGRQWKSFFKGSAAAVSDDASYKIIHAVYPNDDYREGASGPRGKPFLSCYCSPDIKDFEQRSGYWELPYHIPMWNPRARSAYATGPGHNQKADALGLNEMERSHLLAAQFAAEPPVMIDDESGLSAADIVPNAALYGAWANGKPAMGILERKQQVQLSLAQSEQRRNAIRAAFYYSIMQLVQRPQMTATEFLGFQEEMLKLMAHNLVRVQTGGLSPFIARRYRMLDRAGQMPPPPPELANKHLSVEYTSPLAKLQKVAEGRGILQAQQAFEQMALTDPGVRDYFDGDKAAPVVADAFTSIPILRDKRDVDAMRAARAQQQAQAVKLEQAGQIADVAATVSHAQQAKTLADKRGSKAA